MKSNGISPKQVEWYEDTEIGTRLQRPEFERLQGDIFAGKVERSQQTDEMEFWVTVDLSSPGLSSQLEEWQFFYNWQRPHSALRGLTPMNRYCELIQVTPLQQEAHAAYDRSKERYQERDYKNELRLRAARSLRCG